MRRLFAAFSVVMALAAVGATSAVAAPDPGLKITPDKMLNFGTVPVGSLVIKDVTILNRTDTTLYYAGATNGNPGQSGTYPNGIWGWTGIPGDSLPFACFTIAPKSSCTVPFSFMPYQVGPFTALDAGGNPLTNFGYTYTDGTNNYSSNTILMKGVGS